MKFKNKILILLITFIILFSSCISSNVYAFTNEDVDYNKLYDAINSFIETENIDISTYKYFTIWINPGYSTLFLYLTKIPLYFSDSGYICPTEKTTGYYKCNVNITTYDVTSSFRGSTTLYKNENIPDRGGCTLTMSNYDVYDENGSTIRLKNNFFYHPVVEGTVLAPILVQETKELEKANLQIRVLIPLILVVVVSFLGLRKALQMLSTILHRS